MPSLAGKPVQYMIIPDPLMGKLATIQSVTSEAGQYAGGVVPDAGNRGLLLPFQSGVPSLTAVDADVKLVASGGISSSEWIWKRSTDGSDQWLGQDDPRRMWGFHTPRKLTPYSDNIATVYSSLYKTITTVNVSDSTNIITMTRRNVDSTRYDEWTHTTSTAKNDIESGHHNCTIIELPDGTLMLAMRTNTGSTDFDIYHSSDGGATWYTVAEQILSRFDASTATHDLNCQVRMAISGEWIRLCWINSSAGIETRISTDRGMSWSSASFPSVVGTNGDTDDYRPFSLIALDDAGTFLLRHLHPSTLTNTQGRTAVQDGDWSTSFGGYDVTSPQNVYQVVHARKPGWIYEFIFWSLSSLPAALGNSAWTIRRVKQSEAADPNAWEESQQSSGLAGLEDRWGRVQAAWAGDRFFLYGARKNEVGGADQNLGIAMYLGGWNKLTWGGRGQGVMLDKLGNTGVYHYLWHCESTSPGSGTGTPWVGVAVGSGSASTSNDRLQITGAGVGDAAHYDLNLLAAESWGFANDAAFSWRMQLDSGDSTVAADDVACRFFGSDGTDHWDISIRIGPTSIVVFDNVSLATVSTLNVSSDGSGYNEFRFWIDKNRKAQLHVYDSASGTWTSSVVFTATLFVAGATFNTIRFGHLGQTQSTTMVSRWREFGYTKQTRNQDGGDATGFTNPDNLLGMPAASRRTYLSDGMFLSWAGAGGARNDLFSATVDHRHSAEMPLTQSPRLDWRSGGADPQAVQTMIFDAGADRRFVHDAIALFGLTDRKVRIDYDDNTAFSSPTTTQTLDTTMFNTDSVALSVSSVSSTSITITSTNSRFLAGEATGYCIRMTSGTANGKTFRVTRHLRDTVFDFDDETDLVAQGVSAADTFVVFATWGALTYTGSLMAPQRYMRLRFNNIDTAEGDHRLGHIVAGYRLSFDVPLDWTYTDSEQPNVTDYRTMSAVSWSFVEGPVQRKVQARLVGDATERQRDKMRALLRQINYVGRPVAWVPDEDQAVRGVMLCTVTSGSSLDNAAWLLDSNDERRTAGDQSIVLEEVV